MADFETSTLWRISAFQRAHDPSSGGDFNGQRPTLLPTTLLADLRRLQNDPDTNDVLEVVAACVRHRESALLNFELGPWVWPVTLFPSQDLYHSPREVRDVVAQMSLSRLRLFSPERPVVRPPGHVMHERVTAVDRYHPLADLVWALALDGPRQALLSEISGRAAYRVVHGRNGELPQAPGALAPILARLRVESSSLREIASWPGMSPSRASRLLNALYLTGGLLVARSHPAARDEPAAWRSAVTRRH